MVRYVIHDAGDLIFTVEISARCFNDFSYGIFIAEVFLRQSVADYN